MSQTGNRHHDWIGAQALTSAEEPAPPHGNQVFVIWRSRDEPGTYLVTATEDLAGVGPPMTHRDWQHVKTVRESGRARIGFSEAAAKADIAAKGYHLLRLDVNTLVAASDEDS